MDAGHLNVADTLLERLIDEYPDALDARHAVELRGDIDARRGCLDQAAHYFRRAIGDEDSLPRLSGTSGQLHLKLAEVLFTLDPDTHGSQITEHLRNASDHLTFNADVFRWCILNTRIAVAVGDDATAKVSARRALAAASDGPQFSRHPTVGLVDTDRDTLHWLERVARS